MATIFQLETNTNLTPKFEKGTVVLLQRDYTVANRNEYLVIGTTCSVIECALSQYPKNSETGQDNGDTDNIEWCHVSISMPVFDPDYEQDFIKAEDLKRYKISSQFYKIYEEM